MKRLVLPILALLVVLFVAPAVYAQGPIATTCDDSVQPPIDNNGNICTVVNTYGGSYDPYTGWSYPETTEDNKAFDPTKYNAAVSAPAGYYFNIGLAYDPLLLQGGPLENTCGPIEPCYVYGYVSTDLSSQGLQGVLSFKSTYVYPYPTQIGAIMQTDNYTVGNLTSGEANYTYAWTGTYQLVYRCTKISIRYHRCNSVPAEGKALLSAFPK